MELHFSKLLIHWRGVCMPNEFCSVRRSWWFCPEHTHTQCAVAKSISTLTKHTPESLRIYHCFQVCLMLKVGCQAVDCWQKKYHSRPKDLIFLWVISSPNSNGVCPWSVSGQAASPENMEQLLGSSLAHLGRTRHEGAIIKSNCHMLWIKTKAKRTMPVVSEP